MTQEPKITAALIYDFDGTLAPGNMQEYDFIPAVGKSNKHTDHYGQTYVAQTIRELNPQIFSWLDLLDVNVYIILSKKKETLIRFFLK